MSSIQYLVSSDKWQVSFSSRRQMEYNMKIYCMKDAYEHQVYEVLMKYIVLGVKYRV